MQIRDARGRLIDFEQPPTRVVSLVPSLTETLFDLDAAESIAGVTSFCIFPAGIRAPRLGGTKNPDVAAIRRLRPDLVYMNLEENLRKHAEEIESFAPVFATEPKTVGDVLELITALGRIHDRSGAAAMLGDRLRSERAILPRPGFTFACAIWKDPWMWCGGDTYTSNLIASRGGRNVLQESSRYPRLTPEELRALSPEIVFLPDEPYLFTTGDALEIGERCGASIHGPFPGHLVTWHGSRTILGLRFLNDLLG